MRYYSIKGLVFFSLFIFSISTSIEAQTQVKIFVFSVNNGGPIENASVTLINNELDAQTNKNGIAVFEDVSNPVDVLSISKEGFEGQTLFLNLEVNKNNESVIILTPSLDEISVEAKRASQRLEDNGYVERKDTGAGTFLDEEAIENKNAYRATDIFTGISGVKLERIDGRQTLVTTRQITKPGKVFENSGPCPLKIYVDGSELSTGYEGLDQAVEVSQVTAVEIYNSPSSAPVQYSRFAPCGVVLIWTK